MSAISVFAVLTTGIAIGAAGHAAFTTAPEGSHVAVAAAPAVRTGAASAAEVQPGPIAAPQVQQFAAPRECRPEQGIVTDCTYM